MLASTIPASARMILPRSSTALLLLAAVSIREPAPRPTLAVLNARVWTGDEALPRAEALLVAGDRIVAVGTSSEVRPHVGDARAIDASGRFLVPGFVDAHVHFLQGGLRLASVQLREASRPEELTRRIARFARTLPAGTWILGGDWDHQSWGGELPRRDWIDPLTPQHPVWVQRLDGHMALANTLALEAAGVTGDTPDVEGGTIERDPGGLPTGLLRDKAMALVEAAVPPPSAATEDRALEAAMGYAAARGVTSVHHMGSWEDLETFRRARSAGRLTTRIHAAVPIATWKRLRDLVAREGRGDEWLGWGNLKGFVDGSLGSHTALFHAPYDDQPADRGLLVSEVDDLERWIREADAAGLQVSVHAIGDRANHLLLDIYERVASEHGPRDRRFRVEHAQHLRPEDVPRFGTLGVIASMQPYHAIDDGRWAEALVGSRRVRTTYAFKSLLEAGAKVAFGSDWFVAPPTPLEGIYAAVTRRTLDGAHPGGWGPEQKIPVEEALVAYTRSAAYAAFDETNRGVLRPGLLADFVVLDRDLTTISPEELHDARVLVTVVGGRTVYEAEDARWAP
jgi:predicted amidohydrolase YtcJ